MGFTMVLMLKPSHACDAISAVAEFVVYVADVEAQSCVSPLACWQRSWSMLLMLKPSHACDVISVVAEFVVYVADVEAQSCMRVI
jgi:hypothetical protein